MRSQKLDPIIILTVILVAIVLALGLFLAFLFIQNRPPVGTFPVVVEGVEIMIRMNPDDRVVLVESPGQGGEEPPPEQPSPTPQPPPPPTETPIPPTPTPTPSMHILVDHLVGANDTLFSIANQYNTTIPLMARFGVSAANLMPGAVIRIAVANPAYCPGRRPYVIREGDSPFGISNAAGISLEEFRQINNLNENSSLQFTNVVCLP